MDPLVMRAKARVGTVLHNKYRLDVLLGVGGMAAVYAATHRNGSRAAIRILHPELSLNSQVRTRFLREGYVANTVAHDGAVRVSDDDTAEDGSAFLVMELLKMGKRSKTDASAWAASSRRTRFSLRRISSSMCSPRHTPRGSCTATSSPRTSSSHVRVALRSLISESRDCASYPRQAPPPSQARRWARRTTWRPSRRAGSGMRWMDALYLWALGATMFHALTGTLVHDGRTTNEVLLAAMTKPAPSLGTVAPNISPTVVTLWTARSNLIARPDGGTRATCRRPCGTPTTTDSERRSGRRPG